MAIIGLVADADDDGAAASPPRSQSPASEYQSYQDDAKAAQPQRAAAGGATGERLMPNGAKFEGLCYDCGALIAVGEPAVFLPADQIGGSKGRIKHPYGKCPAMPLGGSGDDPGPEEEHRP
jgi:hypothetical protein